MQFNGTPGLVLPGGGARAAYQVGVLKAIAQLMDDERLPFPIIAGISAGSINAAAIAQHADDFVGGVHHLERIWTSMRAQDVFEVEVSRLQALFTKSRRPLALFNNGPLAALIQRELDVGALQHHIGSGELHGIAVTASNYTNGDATTFVQAHGEVPGWNNHRHRSVMTPIGAEHLLASSALPLLFPAQQIGADYYVDGSLRMTAPLSPAINLGADRVLVIGVRNDIPAPRRGGFEAPGLGEIGGYTLESIFAENLNADIERMEQINELLSLVPPWRRKRTGRRCIEVMVIRPSQDIRVIAARFLAKLPRSIRLFLRAIGGWGNEWRLPSYLLFEGPFTSALIDLGYRDGLKQRPALEVFFR